MRNCEAFSGGGEVPAGRAYLRVRARRIAVPIGFIAALGITLATGAPRTLPGFAMDSTVLFHTERAAALLAAWLFVLVIVARAWAGELPTELSGQGFKYSSPDVTSAALDKLADTVEVLRLRVDVLESAE
jgi:hypothetical protein